MNCCICLENIEIADYTCNTCKEGIICSGCMNTINENECGGIEYAFNYADKLTLKNIKKKKYNNELKRRLSCPCCRKVNWKYLFSSVIEYMNEGISYNDDYNDAVEIFYKNSDL